METDIKRCDKAVNHFRAAVARNPGALRLTRVCDEKRMAHCMAHTKAQMLL